MKQQLRNVLFPTEPSTGYSRTLTFGLQPTFFYLYPLPLQCLTHASRVQNAFPFILCLEKFYFPKRKSNLDSNPGFATSRPVTLGQLPNPSELNGNQNWPLLSEALERY